MAHTISEHRMQARLREFAGEKIAAEKRAAAAEVAYCRRIVALWNARAQHGRKPSFFPTIQTAVTAGMPILTVLCSGCRCVGNVDLRTLDQHPMTAISGLIPSLSCRGCSPHVPFVTLIGLRAAPEQE